MVLGILFHLNHYFFVYLLFFLEVCQLPLLQHGFPIEHELDSKCTTHHEYHHTTVMTSPNNLWGSTCAHHAFVGKKRITCTETNKEKGKTKQNKTKMHNKTRQIF